MIVLLNSHCISYTFLIRKVGRRYFLNVGVEGLKRFRWWKCVLTSDFVLSSPSVHCIVVLLYYCFVDDFATHQSVSWRLGRVHPGCHGLLPVWRYDDVGTLTGKAPKPLPV